MRTRIPYTWIIGPWRSRHESRRGVGIVVHDDRGVVTRAAPCSHRRARALEDAAEHVDRLRYEPSKLIMLRPGGFGIALRTYPGNS